MMRKKTTFGFALTCVLIAAAIAFTAGFLIAGARVKDVTGTQNSTSGYALLDEVEQIIDENYLGTKDSESLIRGLCKGYVEGLNDSAAKYLTAEEYAAYTKTVEGETILYKNFGKGVGYIQFLGFTNSTKQSFTSALSDFSGSATSKVSMLVLDIRNCKTGDIEVVASLLDLLLPEGETIAGIDKDGTRSVLYTSDSSALDYDIAVLVNENTSGAAEMFASTLNAYGKAKIVGKTTAGSCARTEAKQLSNGDYLIIPQLYYVTKGQHTYSNTGIVPSVIVEFSAAEQKAFDNSTLDIASDPQFIAAVKALGVNDVATVSINSDTDKASDTDKSSGSDSDSDSDSNTSSTSSGDTSSEENLDPYWDDDEYWDAPSTSGDESSYDEDYEYDDYYNNDDGYDYYDEDEEW